MTVVAFAMMCLSDRDMMMLCNIFQMYPLEVVLYLELGRYDQHGSALRFIGKYYGKYDTTLINVEQIDPWCPVYKDHAIPTLYLAVIVCHKVEAGISWLVLHVLL